jgi:hypothetical protein
VEVRAVNWNGDLPPQKNVHLGLGAVSTIKKRRQKLEQKHHVPQKLEMILTLR